MTKTKKKSAPKASHKKTVKNLDVKPAKGRTVRGGFSSAEHGAGSGNASLKIDGESQSRNRRDWIDI